MNLSRVAAVTIGLVELIVFVEFKVTPGLVGQRRTAATVLFVVSMVSLVWFAESLAGAWEGRLHHGGIQSKPPVLLLKGIAFLLLLIPLLGWLLDWSSSESKGRDRSQVASRDRPENVAPGATSKAGHARSPARSHKSAFRCFRFESRLPPRRSWLRPRPEAGRGVPRIGSSSYVPS